MRVLDAMRYAAAEPTRREHAVTRVVGSVRVSTEEQGLGDSLAAQEARIRAYCIANHLELVRIEVDDTSASTLAREGLDRARAAVAAGEASGIVVTKLDRLTRSVRDLEHLKEQGMGAKGGWRLFSVEEQVDTETPTGNMFLQLLTVFAEWERRTTAKRTKDLLAYAKAQGQPLGSVPYGWRLVKVSRDAAGRRTGERGRLEPDETQQAHIAAIRRWREQGLSLGAIAASLNAGGVTGAMGGQWTATSIRRVLKASAAQAA